MTHLTLAEQERAAYVTGHVFMAELMAKADNGLIAEEKLEDNAWEHENEVTQLEETIKALQARIADLEYLLAAK